MASSSLSFSAATILLLLAILHLEQQSVLADSTCGSLITYRQYEALLEGAPQCFIQGCTQTVAPSSMSDACPQAEPCSELWALIATKYQQQEWCRNCTTDVACRISGWPILNATALCDIAPNTPGTWLFGGEGSCCSSGNQSAELARWMGTMCNGSEWRRQFDHYNGMAQLDWEEWIQPWNWTVRAENTSTVIVAPSHCTHTPLTLLAFFGENVLLLLFSVSLSVLKLMYIRGREREVPWVKAFHKNCHFLVWLKFWQWRQRLSGTAQGEEENESPTSKVLTGVLWSVLILGIQLGFTFASAYHITQTPGYHHVPFVRLALLFCCRPRLGWLACGIEFVTGEKILKRWFNFQDPKFILKAKVALGSVSFGAALSEITLQLLSAYYMGLTANVGRIRGFYLLHRIRPFWRGRDAQHMYLGALFWLIGSLFILIAWSLIFFFGTRAYGFINRQYQRLRNSLRRKRRLPGTLNKLFKSKRAQEKAPSEQEIIRHDNEGPAGEKLEGDSGAAGERLEIDRNAAGERIEGDHGIAGERLHPDRGGLAGERLPMDQDGVAGERLTPPSSDPIERLRLRSSNLRDGDLRQGPIERIGMNSPAPSGTVINRSGLFDGQTTTLIGSQGSSTPAHAGPSMATTAHGPTRDGEIINPGEERTQAIERDRLPGETEEGTQAVEHERLPDETEEERRTRQNMEFAVGFGLLVGILTWAVQWAFWVGFIYTAGERFCPPSLLSAAGLWVAASLSGVGLPFVLQ